MVLAHSEPVDHKYLQRLQVLTDMANMLNDNDIGKQNFEDVIINGWFGPIGCKSPLHHDPYHNLLVQVCGYKFVRLFAPSEPIPKHCKYDNNSSLGMYTLYNYILYII